MLTLDIDDCSVESYREIIGGFSWLSEFDGFVHTTRSHTETKPRIRVVVLLDREVIGDEYVALSRIAAWYVDDTMDSIDQVSFRPAQMMFWPTASRDQTHLYEELRGDPMKPEDIFRRWKKEEGGDYRNMAELPFSKKRGGERRRADKSEDPLTKRGVIGAFCRVYDVETAIGEFLSDVYELGDKDGQNPRYTYLAGSSQNGAVVYDDAKFLYSHHDTDPCYDQNVNAFDLVRLHKFGEADRGKDLTDKPVTEHPSYKAMVEFANGLKAVKQELADEIFGLASEFDEYDDEEEVDLIAGQEDRKEDAYRQDEIETDPFAAVFGHAPIKPGEGLPPRQSHVPIKIPKRWRAELALTGTTAKNTIENIHRVLLYDKRLSGKIRFNKLLNEAALVDRIQTHNPLARGVEPKNKLGGERITDTVDHVIRFILNSETRPGEKGGGYEMGANRDDIANAVNLVSRENKFHPFLEIIEALPPWDQKARLKNFWKTVAGCPNNAYYRETGALLFIAILARCYNPGLKFDYVTVLAGRQGSGKSSLIPTIAQPEFTGELTADFGETQKIVEETQGRVMMEFPELTTLRRGDLNEAKRWITQQSDRVRLSYDRRAKDFPRQFICVGTSNDHTYLRDTENRRYWPITLRQNWVDNPWIKKNLAQLWAEALSRYHDMCREVGDYRQVRLDLSPEADAIAKKLQNKAREETTEDAYAIEFEAWLNEPKPRSEWEGKTNTSGFDRADDEDDFAEDYDPIVVPVRVTWAYVDQHYPTKRFGASASKVINTALQRMQGWRAAKVRLRGAKTQTRGFVRTDATKKERDIGYRIVQREKEDGDD